MKKKIKKNIRNLKPSGFFLLAIGLICVSITLFYVLEIKSIGAAAGSQLTQFSVQNSSINAWVMRGQICTATATLKDLFGNTIPNEGPVELQFKVGSSWFFEGAKDNLTDASGFAQIPWNVDSGNINADYRVRFPGSVNWNPSQSNVIAISIDDTLPTNVAISHTGGQNPPPGNVTISLTAQDQQSGIRSLLILSSVNGNPFNGIQTCSFSSPFPTTTQTCNATKTYNNGDHVEYYGVVFSGADCSSTGVSTLVGVAVPAANIFNVGGTAITLNLKGYQGSSFPSCSSSSFSDPVSASSGQDINFCYSYTGVTPGVSSTIRIDCNNDSTYDNSVTHTPSSASGSTQVWAPVFCSGQFTSGNYIVGGKIEQGANSAQDTVNINVSAPASFNLALSGNPISSISPGTAVSFTFNVTGASAGALAYEIDCDYTGTFSANTTVSSPNNPHTLNSLCGGVYSTGGATYTAAGRASQGSNSDTEFVTITTSGSTPKPTANFQITNASNNPITSVTVGTPAKFWDSSTASSGQTLISWIWNFGSGASPSSASGAGPHNVTYGNPGTKTITLTVSQSNGAADTISKILTVSAGSTFSITATPVPASGAAGMNVAFNLQAFNETGPINFSADCNADGTINNILSNTSGPWPKSWVGPCNSFYTSAGIYAGIMRAIDINSGDTAQAPITVVVTGVSAADFSFSVNDFTVSFNGSASGGSPPYTEWCWNFGDGTPVQCGITSNPSHVYNTGGGAGTFTVTLTVKDSNNVTSAPVSKSVSVGPPISLFSISFLNPINATNISELVDAIINFFALIVIPIGVGLIVYAALKYIISGALPEERQKSIKTIQYALMGIVVVLMAKVAINILEFLLS
ncbi:MAG: hypothetical protein A3B96_02775 [Candidatus Spechtbacteria bacterium RIFCSPHIGHO2_02_FULL_43_15b]|uniref:PKD domain-containing protein n=1 Tax=Candidatus Spechtbacteria bacterium RIFCSPHIGHO2_01_FULL_43_30 TaxID=1802158 RepID=A0A1G2H6Q4_9BACT|nr:MAG: hypothetical protein A2827_02930 [Candidatus Spechtbacteria bacterium RIFCSPHIGHO2_01_FULL_43_30]OGZ60221.1 MAG: hypothetical protein A3B96_02775 [Candidatus Spechtbacteria bacterium RIFCSPHIGHO2_02_FULL_43_15b]